MCMCVCVCVYVCACMFVYFRDVETDTFTKKALGPFQRESEREKAREKCCFNLKPKRALCGFFVLLHSFFSLPHGVYMCNASAFISWVDLVHVIFSSG